MIDMKTFHSHAKETHTRSLALKVRVFGNSKIIHWLTADTIPDKPVLPPPEASRR